jgi:hypothetical protein
MKYHLTTRQGFKGANKITEAASILLEFQADSQRQRPVLLYDHQKLCSAPTRQQFLGRSPSIQQAYTEQELIIHNRQPTIGWSSFFDTQSFLYIETTPPLRRHPDHQGRVGRPTRSRVVLAKRSRVPAALLSFFHSITRHLLPAAMQNDPDLIDHHQNWFVVWNKEHERAKREVQEVLMGDVETEMEIEGVEEDLVTENENPSGEDDDLVSMNLDKETQPA